MGLVIFIEKDERFIKEIKENLSSLVIERSHELLLFNSLDEFKKAKSENKISQNIELFVLNQESLLPTPIEAINAIQAAYNCRVIVTLFDDPNNSYRKTGSWPVSNIIYKPLDLTILKEHILFSLTPNKKIKPQFVHTTVQKSEIESLRKFKILELTDFGMKVDKFNSFTKDKNYKFYHPCFKSGKHQHVWARIAYETDLYYELVFTQVMPELLTSVRTKINQASSKNRKSVWDGRKENLKSKVSLLFNLDQPEIIESISELLKRHFPDLTIFTKTDLKPNQKISIDLVITDQHLEKNKLELWFTENPDVIHLLDQLSNRLDTEKEFSTDTIRILKPLDKSYLVHTIRSLYPKLNDLDPNTPVTAHIDEFCDQIFLLPVTEFSEAAITFKQKTQLAPDTYLEIALPNDDESQFAEIKAKVHYLDPKADQEGLHEHQIVTYGVKNEHLKQIRLWALQVHIKNQQKA